MKQPALQHSVLLASTSSGLQVGKWSLELLVKRKNLIYNSVPSPGGLELAKSGLFPNICLHLEMSDEAK